MSEATNKVSPATAEPQRAWRVKDEQGESLIDFWRRFAPHSNEVAAAGIIDTLERELAEAKRTDDVTMTAFGKLEEKYKALAKRFADACAEITRLSAHSETASPTDDEIRQAIFAYEGALAEEDDDAGLQAARDALLDMMKRCRDGRPAVTETAALKPLRAVMVFRNFGVAAFDVEGKQTDAQCNLLVEWAELAAKAGFDPTSTVIETDGQHWRVFKTSEGGYNVETANG